MIGERRVHYEKKWLTNKINMSAWCFKFNFCLTRKVIFYRYQSVHVFTSNLLAPTTLGVTLQLEREKRLETTLISYFCKLASEPGVIAGALPVTIAAGASKTSTKSPPPTPPELFVIGTAAGVALIPMRSKKVKNGTLLTLLLLLLSSSSSAAAAAAVVVVVVVMVDFYVLASEVNGFSTIAIRTFVHSLPLACLVLTRTITLIITICMQ